MSTDNNEALQVEWQEAVNLARQVMVHKSEEFMHRTADHMLAKVVIEGDLQEAKFLAASILRYPPEPMQYVSAVGERWLAKAILGMDASVAALRADLEKAKEDARMLDWLETMRVAVGTDAFHSEYLFTASAHEREHCIGSLTLREEIRAAMSTDQAERKV